jgi:hypothetical protein
VLVVMLVVIANIVLADPAYGPVIRVFSPAEWGVEHVNNLFIVHFSIAERKDEDFSNIGSP